MYPAIQYIKIIINLMAALPHPLSIDFPSIIEKYIFYAR